MVILSTNKSKEIVSRLIRNKFDDYTEIWQRSRALEIIETAKHYGLNELAIEMQNDL